MVMMMLMMIVMMMTTMTMMMTMMMVLIDGDGGGDGGHIHDDNDDVDEGTSHEGENMLKIMCTETMFMLLVLHAAGKTDQYYDGRRLRQW